ncbi:MAG: hypothetical protein OES90_07340, partial [Xanthomonadales bacterium]|nr:hypothetical protein [Xanthomonadales bacterium]
MLKFNPFTRWSLADVPHVETGSSVLSPFRLAVVLCVLMAACHQATGATNDSFSDKAAIEQRLQKERNATLATFREMKETIDAWVRVGESLVDDSLIRAEQRPQILQARNEFRRTKRLQYQIYFVITELEDLAGPGISLLTKVLDAAVAIWRAELYLVEDTASFEGKKVSTFRAITFGKLVMLALI